MSTIAYEIGECIICSMHYFIHTLKFLSAIFDVLLTCAIKQGYNKGTWSVAFEVLIINCQVDFINMISAV